MKKRKDVFVYAGLLVASLALAYYASLPVDNSAQGRTEWLKIEPASVSKLSYSDEDISIDISKRGDQLYWVVYRDLKKDPDGEVYEFRANKQVQDVLNFFNPMYIIRDLGNAKDLDLARFDLTEASKSILTIESDGQSRKFRLGKRSYGSREMYLLDEKAQHGLMAAGVTFDKIKNAKSTLYERKLFELADKDITKVTLTVGEAEKVMEHSTKDSKGVLIWSDPLDPSVEKPSYKSLVSKIEKIDAQSYASTSERDALSKLKSFAEFTFFKGSGETVVLKFYKEQKNSENTYWVWSSYLDSYVKVDTARGEAIEKDVPGFVN